MSYHTEGLSGNIGTKWENTLMGAYFHIKSQIRVDQSENSGSGESNLCFLALLVMSFMLLFLEEVCMLSKHLRRTQQPTTSPGFVIQNYLVIIMFQFYDPVNELLMQQKPSELKILNSVLFASSRGKDLIYFISKFMTYLSFHFLTGVSLPFHGKQVPE